MGNIESTGYCYVSVPNLHLQGVFWCWRDIFSSKEQKVENGGEKEKKEGKREKKVKRKGKGKKREKISKVFSSFFPYLHFPP